MVNIIKDDKNIKATIDVDVVSAGTTISDNIIDLATIHSLMIKSNTASNMVFSTRAGFSQTIQKVSVDVNSGDIIYLNQLFQAHLF